MMVIKQTMVNITYPMVMECRKKFIESENVLSEFFQPANILSVPEQLNAEIPRMIVATRNNHSLLNISLIGATLTTNFDGDFVDNWKHCEAYLKARMNAVYNLVDVMTNKNEEYTGLITRLEYTPSDDSAVDIIKKIMLREEGKKLGNPYDLSCKLTYTFEDKYFINVSLENVREYKAERIDGSKALLTETGNSTIGITLDINDRYLANSKKEYRTSKDTFANLLNLTSEFVIGRLENLVATGELIYGI